MKKYLLIALAALGFAACAENQDDIDKPAIGGEVEESYIAINLMSADLETRAATDSFGYEDGTDAERAINSAYFFFFDENGMPFNVIGSNTGATAPAGDKNHLSLAIGETTGKDAPNISDIKNAVLVLNTYKGSYPKQLVAVLNWTPAAKSYSLADLHHELYENTLGNDSNGYVMSNSVYLGGSNKVMDAVAITADNIKTSSADALAAPIDIYVERTAAKVVVTAAVENGRFQVTEENAFSPIGANERTVYMQLFGWELYNEFNTTNILKNVNNWDPATLGLTWNDAPFFRSYWAETINRANNDTFSWSYAETTLPTQYGHKVASAANYTDRDTYTYCGENTLAWSEANDVRTKVILKGQLQELVDGNYKSLSLARWYGNEYAGVSDLKKAIANSVKYSLFYLDSGNYISIAPEHLEVVHGSAVDADAYEVGFQLSTAGQAKTWYLYSSAGGYQLLGDASLSNVDATNALLAEVEPAVLYEEGHTYYIVDIEHLGATDTTAKYGLVRNHVYQIDIKSIKGYGSPGYSGVSFIKPEYPAEYDSSYVAARINVLSWKVVKQGVNIGQ